MNAFSGVKKSTQKTIILLLLLSVIVASLSAEPPEKANATNFIVAMREIARRGRAAIIVEEMPLRATLPNTKVAVWNSGEEVKANLKRVAEAYDFTLTPVKNTDNVFVLRKRYSDARDLPGVTLLECHAALTNILRLMAPHISISESEEMPGDLIPHFLTLLTEAQQKAMERSELRVTDLTPDQRESVSNTAKRIYIAHTTNSVKYLSNTFEQLRQASLEIRQERVSPLFGFPITDAAGRAVFHTLSDVETLEAAKNKEATVPSGPEKSVKPPVERTTLEKAVIALSRWGETQSLSVAPEVAERFIVRFGEEFAAPATLMVAYADAQGLRLVMSPDKRRILKSRAAPQIAELRQISNAVRAALPEPLLRALHEPEIAELQNRMQRFVFPELTEYTPQAFERREKPLNDLSQRRNELEKRVAELPEEALRRLYDRFQQERGADGKPQKRIPIASLTTEERSTLALSLMGRFLSLLRYDIPHEAPRYIQRFNDLIIGGGIHNEEGKQKAYIVLNLYNEQRKELQMETMISGIALH